MSLLVNNEFLRARSRDAGDPPTLAVEEAYPQLSESELIEVQDFGERCTFSAGDTIFAAGDYPFDSYTILSGEVRVVDVSSGERITVVRYGSGRFTGDIDLFTRRPSIVSIEAETDVEAVRLTPAQLREMFISDPALGERYWRSFQQRRSLLLSSEFRGLSVYGDRDDGSTLEAVELLFRNMVPHEWFDLRVEHNAAKLQELREDVEQYPVIAHGNRVLFEAPTRAQLADYLGLRQKLPDKIYDSLVLGCGPSGLGAAVYLASEGRSALVLDTLGPGGQAGSSSWIENYAGFPNGVPGRELAHLMYLQALKFGADFHAPSTVTDLQRRRNGLFRARTSEGDYVLCKTVIVATGVTYGLLDVKGIQSLNGSGVYYSATNLEARLCKGGPVHVIGAGNSAGQAAMFLSRFASEVQLVVRGSSLDKMSTYLCERLLANNKVSIRFTSEVASIQGSQRLESIGLRDLNGEVTMERSCGLFVFIGAKPRTEFLPSTIARDDKGFILTGSDVASHPLWQEPRQPCVLESSLPGVFAAGDCRSGTSKRVAFAIGDGALAVASVHSYLAREQQGDIAVAGGEYEAR